MSKLNTIININNSGWYDFTKLDQTHRYIKVNSLKGSTDRKAINRAKTIIGDKRAKIVVEVSHG